VRLDFELHLKEPKEFFVFDPHTYDPFDEQALGEPALNHLMERVIGFWFRAPNVRTVVYLPPHYCNENTENLLRRANYAWCEDLLIANRRERTEFLINNSLFLGAALLILVVVYFLEIEIVNPAFIQDATARGVLNYALDILIWVALWAPVSGFLIEWFPLFRAHQAYRTLQHMQLEVRPEPESSPAQERGTAPAALSQTA